MDEKLKEYIAKHTSKDTLDVDKFGEDLVKDYEEFDLFGGLFTKPDSKSSLLSSLKANAVKRTSVVKLSYAFSISPFKSDMDFMNNIDAYDR